MRYAERPIERVRDAGIEIDLNGNCPGSVIGSAYPEL